MIERLTGKCVLKQIGSIVLDVAGVGYGLEMTEQALAQIEEGESTLTLWVHTHVREDAIRLFGFPTHAERMLFNLLLSVSGVGPKVAMSILGTVQPSQLIQAIEIDDSAVLEEVPGIGPRQSKKILLELKPKLGKLAALAAFAPAVAMGKPLAQTGAVRARLTPAMLADLRSALENFGYKDKELSPLLKRFERQPPAFELPNLVRIAFAELSGSRRDGEELF